MLTILSMIVGFVTSLAPDLMKRWQDKADKSHEIEMTKLQIAATEKGFQYKADEVGAEAYRDMVVAANQSQSDMLKGASRWVVDFSASVRPTITYLFMIAFIGFKVASLCLLINPHLPWQSALSFSEALHAVWGEEETAIFGGIIAFWFGDRSMSRRRAG